jgi:hypothetical protein
VRKPNQDSSLPVPFDASRGRSATESSFFCRRRAAPEAGNGVLCSADINPEPENERHWVRQLPAGQGSR